MIEAGEVGAVFTVVDKASAVLKAIADQLKVLQERIDAIQARFDGLGAGLGASFDKAALAISSGMGKAADTAIAELGRIDAGAAAEVEAAAAAACLHAVRMAEGRTSGASEPGCPEVRTSVCPAGRSWPPGP